MSGAIDTRLAELGIELPQAAAPAANYLPYVASGPLVFVSGQITVWNGELRYQGKLGADIGLEDGQAAARLCALNIIAQLKAAAAATWTECGASSGSAASSTRRRTSPTSRR